jgi:hypothetical protein
MMHQVGRGSETMVPIVRSTHQVGNPISESGKGKSKRRRMSRNAGLIYGVAHNENAVNV